MQIHFKVPIIAPPACDLIPESDLTAEDTARRRLDGVLKLEKIIREADELGCGITPNRWLGLTNSYEGRKISEGGNGDGVEYAVAAEVSAFLNGGGGTRHASCDRNPAPGLGPPSGILSLGIDDLLRTDVIKWILEVNSLFKFSTSTCIHS